MTLSMLPMHCVLGKLAGSLQVLSLLLVGHFPLLQCCLQVCNMTVLFLSIQKTIDVAGSAWRDLSLDNCHKIFLSKHCTYVNFAASDDARLVSVLTMQHAGDLRQLKHSGVAPGSFLKLLIEQAPASNGLLTRPAIINQVKDHTFHVPAHCRD